MLFIELYLPNDDGQIPAPDEDCDGLCVRASRCPKNLTEAGEWARAVRPDVTGVFLYEPISAEDAEKDYDIREDDKGKVFPLNGK